MKVETLNDMVLVKRLDVEQEKFEGTDIVKPDIAKQLSNKGEIIAVDPNDPQLKVGDVVLFSEHAANDVDLGGESFLLLQRKQVYLRLQPFVLNLKTEELCRAV